MVEPKDDRKVFAFLNVTNLEDLVKENLFDHAIKSGVELIYVEFDGYKNCFKVITKEEYLARKIGTSYSTNSE